MYNYFFDDAGIFVSVREASLVGGVPRNALREEPPFKDGFWPVLNDLRNGWDLVEDHRGEKGWFNGVATEVAALGPLPEGWSSNPPEKTQSELDQERITQIKAQLADLDFRSSRPLRAIVAGIGTDEDRQLLSYYDTLAAGLRLELSTLLS